MDYKKIGLKVGIEIHQRLATKTKLFCNCSAELIESKPIFSFKRRLRPTSSEIGEIDKAAFQEFIKGRDIVYYTYPNNCSVETDSDFPRELNEEALTIVLQLAKLLKMQVPDELHIMRKVVIDGSNTTGYQRTLLVAFGTSYSYIETEYGKVHLKELQLEEESATKIKEDENEIHYRLDRLGIPLIELSCKPEIWHPKQAKEFAKKLGLLLRSLKVQRGIGSIRQDVNISIKEGARIEIKGFQEVEDLDKLIENEVLRQLDLIKIKEKLKNKEIKFEEKEVANLFKNSNSKILKELAKTKILCLKVLNLSGLFKEQCGKITLGKEIANYVKFFGLKGILHTDEDLKKYGLKEEEIDDLKKEMNAKEDLLILVGGKNCEKALDLIKKRIKYLKKGVPEETRFAEGTITRYARELPGAARMYPETDLPKIKVKDLDKIKIPETLEEKKERFIKLGLNKEQAKQMIKSKDLALFESLLDYKVEPKTIADLILNIKKYLEREGKKIGKKELEFVLELLEKDKITKKAIPDILVKGSVKGLEKIKGEKLKKLVESYKKKYGDKAIKELMKDYGKRVDSKEVFEYVGS
jgi:glutamyl-tRNA(Gln) amidotransferase subunit E